MTAWPQWHGEEGAALLGVLLLVAVMGAIAAVSFERLGLATRVAGNAAALDQARAFALAAETIAAARIDTLVGAGSGKTTLAGGWHGRTTTLPLPVGTARVRVIDGGNCFNLNSVVSEAAPGSYVARAAGIAQFTALMTELGVIAGEARRVAASLADWIDSDDEAARDGAEDATYLRAPEPYRTGATLLAEASELRAVNGVTPALYARVRPWVCALPVAGVSPLNVNTLSPAQAPLVAMLAPETLTVAIARKVIADRPAGGWDSKGEFWNQPALKASEQAVGIEETEVRTRWFTADLRVAVGDAELHETALIDAGRTPARVAQRRWAADE